MNTFLIVLISLLAGFLTGLFFLGFLRRRKTAKNLPANQRKIKLIPELRAIPLACRPWVGDDGLDCHQQQALTSPARITLVLAGAGAGKTKVLTKRILLLNRYLGVPIENMMVLVFVNG